ncbi:hypothetical protein PRN20_10895 [Devosia sp. ZB163]|uniref:hypothetical protein n=1 Tax=Devosia sp. ZB163 TaxID=3025938 RepID=UPI00236278BA|nr:hypothetical protein [Devosia sp. ZB163]MDC9824245.1 hypothetical protein [Devosia sp. ZB163]
MRNQTALLYQPNAMVLMDLESVLLELGFTCTTTLTPPATVRAGYSLAVLHLDQSARDVVPTLVAQGTAVIAISSSSLPDLPEHVSYLAAPYLSGDLVTMVGSLTDPLHRRRPPQLETLQRRAAAKLVAPYARRLHDWHSRVARLSAIGSFRRPTPHERQLLIAKIAGLREEVRRAHVEMESVTRSSPRHTLIDDVETGLLKVMQDLAELGATID